MLMAISRTPYRVSFFGGGTDYPAWYRRHGGAVLSMEFLRHALRLAERYDFIIAAENAKFGQPEMAPPPPPQPVVTPPSFMVFFDWDSSRLSEASLNVVRQASAAFKSKGSARIRATGHTDTSGPESYNMALSLRRANAVKDALVRDGVPAAAITVIGRGEAGLLVQTADGVREPQNRRVEIVID